MLINDPGNCYHLWDNVSVAEDLFRIMKCLKCGAIDPCGIPEDYWFVFLEKQIDKKEEQK
jgi:hypothetical protein